MEVPQILDAQSSMALIAKAELETIVDYKRIKQACTCPSCHAIIDEIIRDEWRHVGSALHVIKNNPEVLALLDEGDKEAIEEVRKFEESQRSMVNDLPISS